jgi:RNA polymerase sigma-B factor
VTITSSNDVGRELGPPERRVAPRDTERIRADRELFERLADTRDPVDREMLVERFLPLARSIASRYLRRGEPFDDIFQVACLGLVKAIDRYDPQRGQAFSSFAVPTMAGEIKRYYRDRTWSVHVPRDLQDLTLAVGGVIDEFQSRASRLPTVPEIAERLGVEHDDVLDALQARHAHCAGSLDAPAAESDGSGATVGELLGFVEPDFALAEVRADLKALQRVLTPRQRVVLYLRFRRDMTQQEIGERIGVSQMQVSRILRSALARLRDHADRMERPNPRDDSLAA